MISAEEAREYQKTSRTKDYEKFIENRIKAEALQGWFSCYFTYSSIGKDFDDVQKRIEELKNKGFKILNYPGKKELFVMWIKV